MEKSFDEAHFRRRQPQTKAPGPRSHAANLRRLRQYITACESFVSDLADVLEDLRFLEAGGRLIPAADFSEIHAYALPGEGARDMVHFDQERASEVGLAIEASALETLFFGASGDVLLLEPYRVELANFLPKLRTTEMATEAGQLLDALRDVRELTARDETRHVIALGERLHHGPPPAASELEEAVRFFARHAPALVLFATRGADDPRTRLRHLLGGGRLATPEKLEVLEGFTPQDRDERLREIFDQLESSRRHGTSGANYVDAVALDLLAQMNEFLAGQRIRVLLVSRSRTLAAPLRELDAGDIPLRHPRVWSPFFRPAPGEDWRRSFDEVEERHSALRLFVDSAREHLEWVDARGSRPPSEAEIDGTRRLIERIEHFVDEWLLGQSVLLSGHMQQLSPAAEHAGGESPGSSNPLGGSDTAATVGRLLELVSDDSRIFRQVQERLDDLARDHEYLGWYLQSASPDNQEIISSRLMLEGFGEKAVFSATADSIHYTLQFSSPSLLEVVRGLEDEWHLSFDQFRTLLKEGLAERGNYERLLAMAFTLGLLGRWPLAEKYALAALEETEGDDAPSPHEGHFFLALCHRKSSRSRERLRRGLEHLDAAWRAKCRHVGDEHYRDPRYLKEKATLLQVERSLRRQSKVDESPEAKERAVKEIEDLLRRAAEGAKDDRRLLVQAYNGLCYLYLTEGSKYLGGMRHYRDLLEREMAKLPGGLDGWPANCVDTVCWAHFRDTGDQQPVEVLAAWADQLGRVIERPLLTREDRQRIRRHQRHIRIAAGRRERA